MTVPRYIPTKFYVLDCTLNTNPLPKTDAVHFPGKLHVTKSNNETRQSEPAWGSSERHGEMSSKTIPPETPDQSRWQKSLILFEYEALCVFDEDISVNLKIERINSIEQKERHGIQDWMIV